MDVSYIPFDGTNSPPPACHCFDQTGLVATHQPGCPYYIPERRTVCPTCGRCPTCGWMRLTPPEFTWTVVNTC